MNDISANQSHFFAHLSRMKLINRWPLMRNIRTENVQEHSLQVAMVAHALALIRNKYFDGDLGRGPLRQMPTDLGGLPSAGRLAFARQR